MNNGTIIIIIIIIIIIKQRESRSWAIIINIIWLYFSPSFRYIKMSSPNLNNVIIAGCILIYVAGVLFGLDKEQASYLCQVNAYLP